MAFQKVPDTAAVTFRFSQNNELVVNTIHAERPGGYDLDQVEALAASMDSAALNQLRPIMTEDASYLLVEVRGLNSENDLLVTDSDGAGQGGIVGAGLPNSVTLSIKRSSPFTGRSARGRWYFVGLPAADLNANENQVKEQTVIDIVNALENVRQAVINAGWLPVIVSRFTGGSARSEGVTFDWVTTVAVNGNVDSQRGRLA